MCSIGEVRTTSLKNKVSLFNEHNDNGIEYDLKK